MSQRKPSIVQVHPIIWPKDEILESVKTYVPGAGYVEVAKWAIFLASNGDKYAISDEGVGPSKPITEDNPIQVSVIVYKPQEDQTGSKPDTTLWSTEFMSFTWWPDLQDTWDDDTVNLADWIRTFGRRLEDNYRTWDKALSPLVGKEVDHADHS